MNREAFEELRAFEDRHWWFRGRRAAIREHVDLGLARSPTGAVVDVGCGTGANLAWLAERTQSSRLIGLEPDAHALELASQRGLCVCLLRADASRLPLATACAALIVCCDVLEHIDDDSAACRELFRVLAPGGTLVVTVPAGPSLWSAHDLALGHRRRYGREVLERRLAAAGFEIETRHGFILAFWPLVWIVRRWRRNSDSEKVNATPSSDFVELPSPINAALVGWLWIESLAMRLFRCRHGVSLVVRARRR